MQLMSSKMTFFYKRIFPVIWFGFLAVFFVIALIQGLAAQSIAFIPFIVAKSNDRKADRSNRCGAAERVRTAVSITPQPALYPRGRADLSGRCRRPQNPLTQAKINGEADVRSHLIHFSCEGVRKRSPFR
jgi:hypothetical protein